MLAEIFREENNVNDALRTLHAAKKVEKLNSDVDYNLSLSYKTIRLFKEAILYIDSAIKQKPENQIYKILKADILIECLQYEKAEELLVNLKIKKDNPLNFQKEILISKVFINQKNIH